MPAWLLPHALPGSPPRSAPERGGGRRFEESVRKISLFCKRGKGKQAPRVLEAWFPFAGETPRVTGRACWQPGAGSDGLPHVRGRLGGRGKSGPHFSWSCVGGGQADLCHSPALSRPFSSWPVHRQTLNPLRTPLCQASDPWLEAPARGQSPNAPPTLPGRSARNPEACHRARASDQNR